MKLLFWIVLLAVIAFVLGFLRARPRRAPSAAPAPAPSPAAAPPPVAMIACTECGAHLPVTEALPGRGGQFCSPEHRRQHEARLT